MGAGNSTRSPDQDENNGASPGFRLITIQSPTAAARSNAAIGNDQLLTPSSTRIPERVNSDAPFLRYTTSSLIRNAARAIEGQWNRVHPEVTTTSTAPVTSSPPTTTATAGSSGKSFTTRTALVTGSSKPSSTSTTPVTDSSKSPATSTAPVTGSSKSPATSTAPVTGSSKPPATSTAPVTGSKKSSVTSTVPVAGSSKSPVLPLVKNASGSGLRRNRSQNKQKVLEVKDLIVPIVQGTTYVGTGKITETDYNNSSLPRNVSEKKITKNTLEKTIVVESSKPKSDEQKSSEPLLAPTTKKVEIKRITRAELDKINATIARIKAESLLQKQQLQRDVDVEEGLAGAKNLIKYEPIAKTKLPEIKEENETEKFKKISPPKRITSAMKISPTKDVPLVEKISPQKETTLVRKTSPPKRITSAMKISPTKDVPLVEKISPQKETALVRKTSPPKEIALVKKITPPKDITKPNATTELLKDELITDNSILSPIQTESGIFLKLPAFISKSPSIIDPDITDLPGIEVRSNSIGSNYSDESIVSSIKSDENLRRRTRSASIVDTVSTMSIFLNDWRRRIDAEVEIIPDPMMKPELVSQVTTKLNILYSVMVFISFFIYTLYAFGSTAIPKVFSQKALSKMYLPDRMFASVFELIFVPVIVALLGGLFSKVIDPAEWGYKKIRLNRGIRWVIYFSVVIYMVFITVYWISDIAKSRARMNESMYKTLLAARWANEDNITKFDETQYYFRCCGVVKSEDWFLNKHAIVNRLDENNISNAHYPWSCCDHLENPCDVRPTIETIWKDGCLKYELNMIYAVAGLCVAIEIVIIILSLFGFVYVFVLEALVLNVETVEIYTI